MKFFSLLFILLGLSTQAAEVVRDYSDELCDQDEKIVQEFIDLELAGYRWHGVDETPLCLKKQKPETFTAERVPASSASLLDPEYLLTDTRKIQFKVKRVSGDLLEVVLNYIGRKNGKDFPVKDQFTLKKNYGKSRELRGCASMYIEPDHFVMKSSCWSK